MFNKISETVTRVSRKSLATTKWVHMEIPVSIDRLEAWEEGVDKRVVQDAFPELTPDQREFLLTGISPEEWDTLFQEGDEDIDPENPDA